MYYACVRVFEFVCGSVTLFVLMVVLLLCGMLWRRGDFYFLVQF